MPAGYQKTFEVCGCISGGKNKNGGTARISANGMPEQHDRESQGNQGAESYEDICVTKKMTRIGYGPDADIQIQADTISQLHARIDRDGETYYIEDLNSTNGTFVNDEPLAYKERRKLNSNDMIRFADVRYRFC